MMRRILQPFWFLLAVAFLVEAWLWDHLEPVVARVVALIPLQKAKDFVTRRVAHLSPPLTLVVFLVPVAPLYPLKAAALWLIAQGHWIAGIAAFAAAQFLGLGIAAFIFDVTKPKLMQMGWFVRLYAWMIGLREKARGIVGPIMVRLRAFAAAGEDSMIRRKIRLLRRAHVRRIRT